MAQPGTAAGPVHRRRLSPFTRHFLEMLGVMAAGMFVAAAIFCSVIGMTWDRALVEHPIESLLVVAAGMSIPMFGWMVYRGMGLRNATEMGAAMVVPVLPFLGLVWVDATTTAQCGAYCITTIVAMLTLMLFRRSEYSMEMPRTLRDG
jgi:hypothetical protein